jgi:hypothetical protein
MENPVNAFSHKAKFKRLLTRLGLILTLISGSAQAGLIFPKPPDEARAIVVKNIKDNAPFLGVTNADQVSLSYPHRVYTEMDSWFEGTPFAQAADASAWNWQYLLFKGTNIFGSADISPAPAVGAPMRFGGLQKGRTCAEILQAISAAEKLPQVVRQDYEVRLIEISANIEFNAVWFHAKSDDFFLPLPSAPAGLTPFKKCSEIQIRGQMKLQQAPVYTPNMPEATPPRAPARSGRGATGY